jgi:translation elongation factor P/translation initiation factor 5A
MGIDVEKIDAEFLQKEGVSSFLINNENYGQYAQKHFAVSEASGEVLNLYNN